MSCCAAHIRLKIAKFSSLSLLLGLLTTPAMLLADAPVIQGHAMATPVDSGIPMGGQQIATMPANAALVTQSPEQALVTADEPDDVVTPAAVAKRDPASQIILLQQQLQELRGQLEVQAHTIAQLQAQQTQQYQAIDNRLGQLGAAKLPPVVAASSAVVASTVVAANAAASATPAATDTNNAAEENLYQEASQLVVDKQYAKATVAFQTYLQQYPNGQYAATSHYRLGELALIGGNLPQAENQFTTVVTQFPQSPKAADSMLKIGMIYYNQSQWRKAREEFTALNAKFPNTGAARLAEQQLKHMQRQGN